MTGRHFIADVLHQQGIETGLIPDLELVRHPHQHHVLSQGGRTHQGLRDTYAALRIGDHPLRKTEQFRFDVGKLHGRERDAVQLFDDGFPVRRHVGLEASIQAYGQPEGTVSGGQQGIPVLWRQQQTAFGVEIAICALDKQICHRPYPCRPLFTTFSRLCPPLPPLSRERDRTVTDM